MMNEETNMTKETAAERRAREVREANEANQRWMDELPMFALQEMARAYAAGMDTRVERVHTGDDPAADQLIELFVRFEYDDPDFGYREAFLRINGNDSTKSWENEVSCFIDTVIERNAERDRMRNIRETALSKLTPEERKALNV